MPEMNMIQAVNSALKTEMARDERVIVLGEDVGKFGGVFRATAGLIDEFGEERLQVATCLIRLHIKGLDQSGKQFVKAVLRSGKLTPDEGANGIEALKIAAQAIPQPDGSIDLLTGKFSVAHKPIQALEHPYFQRA